MLLIEERIHLRASSPGYFPPCPLSVSVSVCFQISPDWRTHSSLSIKSRLLPTMSPVCLSLSLSVFRYQWATAVFTESGLLFLSVPIVNVCELKYWKNVLMSFCFLILFVLISYFAHIDLCKATCVQYQDELSSGLNAFFFFFGVSDTMASCLCQRTGSGTTFSITAALHWGMTILGTWSIPTRRGKWWLLQCPAARSSSKKCRKCL